MCYKNPQEAERAGIVFIHQELNVLFDLTVEENLFKMCIRDRYKDDDHADAKNQKK